MLDGVLVIDIDRHADDRGFFARVGCVDEFAAHGITESFPQMNLSHNLRRGTLRGMHYAVAPARESKIVRCVAGAIHDVVIDVRPDSATYGGWLGIELSRANGRALYIPPGLAHGFLTLSDDTDVLYLMGDVFRPEAARGLRWDDPRFGVEWPFAPIVIADRDATYPDFSADDGVR
jgi:dTDP-4-dehydrorhamnose 3,5-epimerase